MLEILDLVDPKLEATREYFRKTDLWRYGDGVIDQHLSHKTFSLEVQHVVKGLHVVRLTNHSCRGGGTYVNERKLEPNESITLFNEDVIAINKPEYKCKYSRVARSYNLNFFLFIITNI